MLSKRSLRRHSKASLIVGNTLHFYTLSYEIVGILCEKLKGSELYKQTSPQSYYLTNLTYDLTYYEFIILLYF